jgi:hypothetical protein
VFLEVEVAERRNIVVLATMATRGQNLLYNKKETTE